MNRIYVVAHKKYTEISDPLYETIQVGKKNSGIILKGISDDTQDNIADKNSTFCELTALYWIWKNDNAAEYIGLCHYRRYFSWNVFSNSNKFFLNNNDIEKIMRNSDVILPKKDSWIGVSVREYYSIGAGLDKDIVVLQSVISKLYPEYLRTLEYVLNSNSASYRNMFVMGRGYLSNYCDWLFTILFELERCIDINDYTKQEKRIYGYIAEILLNVWVEHNRLKVKYIDVVNIETSPVSRMKKSFKYMCKKTLNCLGFRFKEKS